MSFMLVLVSGHPEHPLNPGHLARVERFFDDQHLRFNPQVNWLHIHKAAEFACDDKPSATQLRDLRSIFAEDKIDVFLVSSQQRRKKLLLADMDATIVTSETLDELAAECGLGAEISAITAHAMRGELDFKGALMTRVGMLKGTPVKTLQTVLDRTEISAGAEQLIRVMRHYGATCVLVSGGFTFFTKAIAAQLGFHFSHGNNFDIADNTLTGQVVPPILDKDAKLNFLKTYRDKMGLPPAETMALGDGANDLPMLLEAGLGLGYHPKPLLLENLENCIVYSDLTSALYIQGYTWPEIEQALTPSIRPEATH